MSQPAKDAKSARPKASRRKSTPTATLETPAKSPRAKASEPSGAVAAVAAPLERSLTEEERIESAKYQPRQMPARVFEEERFLFPDTYGVSRVRLLIKDPEWLFAHWDVDPALISSLRTSLGERATALSRLTLRISDVENGGVSIILLPEGSRSWYVRTDSARRSYRAELGLTLPSGEFRKVAESNTVTSPRTGPSDRKAERVLSYGEARHITAAAAFAAGAEERHSSSEAGPWSAPPQGVALSVEPPQPPSAATAKGKKRSARGGASETFRR
jgi:hypothetical protein